MDELLGQLLRRWLLCQEAEKAGRDLELAGQPPEVRVAFHRERAALEDYADSRRNGDCELEGWLADHPNLSPGAVALARQIDRVVRDNRGAKWLGRQIGPYTVLYLLGRGGMAEVYAVEKVVQGEWCVRALKLVHLADIYAHLGDAERRRLVTDLRVRLRREAESLERIQHPNVVRYYDRDDDPATGEMYFVTALVNGFSLQRILEEGGAFPPAEALAVVTDVCAGLVAVHAVDVTHRDLSTTNVIVDGEGIPRIIDFGLSSAELGLASVTRPDSVPWCTRRFASPEQRPGGSVTPATDQWSLAKLFYVLLRYQPEWEQHPEWPLPPSGDPAWQGLPPGYAELILRATAERPGDRFPDTAAMLEALRGLTPGAALPRTCLCARVQELLPENAPLISLRLCLRLGTVVVIAERIDPVPPPPPPPPRSGFRGKVLIGLASVVVLVAVVFGIGWLHPPGTPDRQGPPPPPVAAPVKYHGEFNLLISERNGQRQAKEIVLGGPGGLRVRGGDRVYFEFKLNEGPDAHFYVLHVNTQGVATLLYPPEWTLDQQSEADQPRQELRLPSRGDCPLRESSVTGYEALVWFVRDRPLTQEDNQALKKLLTRPNLKWEQPRTIEDGVVWMEDGKITRYQGAPALSESRVSPDPISQTQNVQLELKERKLARYLRAACYPFSQR